MTEEVQVRAQVRARRLASTSRTAQVARSREAWPGQPAAVYCRISHVKDQDQTGVERQERICREIAQRYGLTVAPEHVFVDNNRSAWRRSRKRAGWDAMLAAAARGGVRHIVAYHPDRLMRQPRDLEELLTIADEHGITLHGQANQRDLSDPDDRFMLRIEVAHACRSSDDTSRRLKDAMIDRARDGLPHSGKRRYGYAPGGMALVPEEAAIVREVFARYLDGVAPATIARDLTARGVATAEGKSWTAQRLRMLLDSHHVAGLRVFRGEEIGRGEWPAIIDEPTFREVADRRAFRSASTAPSRQAQRFYLLRGVVMCARCGTHMTGGMNTYECTRRHRTDDSRCVRRISAPGLEEFVTDAAIDLLERLTVAGPDTATMLSADDRAAIEADQVELTELKQMWDAQEITTRDYRSMRRTVQARIDAIEAKTQVRPAATVLDGLTGPHARATWRELERRGEHSRLNAVLRYLFAAVVIDASTRRGPKIDYRRISIRQNPM